MAPYRVWAPFAKRVAVIVGNDLIDMVSDADVEGWWQTAERRMVAGEDYRFRIDDSDGRDGAVACRRS
jgi:1,4-alpha-glucan branching enzyme